MRRSHRVRLAFRFLISEPLHSATLLLVFTASLAGALIFSEVAQRNDDRLIAALTESYGVVNVRPPADDREIAYPHLAHRPDSNGGWISAELLRAVTQLGDELGFSVSPRIRGAAGTSDGRTRPFLARFDGDWAGGSNQGGLEIAPLQIVVQRSEHSITFLEVPDSAIIGTHDEPEHLWLDGNWLAQVLDVQESVNVPANELAIEAEGDPFALAFDIRELLRAQDIDAAVTAWGEFLGLERYAATQSGAATEQLLILVTAVLAVAGVTSVSVHNRTGVTALMRTVGISNDDIRRVYLLELLVVATVAVGLLSGLLAIVSAAGELALSGGAIRRTLLLGIAVPPLTGFFSVRRQLRKSLHTMQQEALR